MKYSPDFAVRGLHYDTANVSYLNFVELIYTA